MGYRLAIAARDNAPQDLPPADHHVLLMLALTAPDNTGILERWTVATIAAKAHVSYRQARRIIDDLTLRGLIVKQTDTAKIRRGTSQIYRIVYLKPQHRRELGGHP